jgi:hypothetical protein
MKPPADNLDRLGLAWPDLQRRAALWRIRAEISLWRHGIGWWLAAVAIAGAAAGWWYGVQPLQRRLQAIDAQLRQPAPRGDTVKADAVLADENARLLAFREVPQPYRDHAAQVRRLVALTSEALKWEQAEFAQSPDDTMHLVRLQITVPVSGPYRPMRAALERALLELPNLALDQVAFNRKQAGAAQVEARIRLSLWLHAPASRIGVPPPAGAATTVRSGT